jgi:hypothetical protein
MKKLRIILSSLCLIAVLALAVPSTAYADDDGGPQGGSNSTKGAPPPPPPPPLPIGTLTLELILKLMLTA